MKRVVLFVLNLSMSLLVLSQTITQKGVAYRYNGKQQRTPLGNVTIQYDANQRTALSSEQNGVFTLLLEGRKMGDRIGVVTVKKREMMVFNQHAVDEWSVRKEPLRLILCNVDEFERQKANLIEIGKREAKKKYDRLKKELEAKLNESQIKQQEYEASLDKAYEELERFQNNVGEYADLFARIDESEVDTLAQRALDLFNKGETERAIRLFEDGNYLEKLENALVIKSNANKAIAKVKRILKKAEQDSINAVNVLKAQVDAYKINNQWAKAGELLKMLADRLNTWQSCYEYASFCSTMSLFEEDLIYSQKAFDLFVELIHLKPMTDHECVQYCNLTNMLACANQQMGYFSKALELYEASINIMKYIAKEDPKYNYWVAWYLNNMGSLYMQMEQPHNAKESFNQAFSISQGLFSNNPHDTTSVYQIQANCLSNVGHILIKDSLDTALSYFEKALEIRKLLSRSQSPVFQLDVAKSLRDIAYVYFVKKEYAKSTTYVLSSIDIIAKLYANNPNAYYRELNVNLSYLNKLGNLFLDEKNYDASEKVFLTSLDMYRLMNKKDDHIVYQLHCLGNIYSLKGQFNEGEKYYLEALKGYRIMAENNPIEYKNGLADMLYTICVFYSKYNKIDKNLSICIETIELLKTIDASKYSDRINWLQKTIDAYKLF